MPRKRKERKHRGVFERQKGSNIWWIRFVDFDGKRKSRCIGTFSDAVDAYETEKVRIRRGHVTGGLRQRNGVRLSALCDSAVAYSEGRHRDKRNFMHRVEVVRKVFGSRSAESLLPSEIQAWLDSNPKWSSATKNRYRSTLSKVIQFGIKDRLVTHNAARAVPLAKESAGRIRFLSADEEARLRSVIKPCYALQLDVALHTGMRMSEQFSLTWNDVDLELREIVLSLTKNGSSRTVKLNAIALAALKIMRAEHTRMKFSPDATLFYSQHDKPMLNPKKWFEAGCIRAKIKDATWHTLRHTFASRLVMAGVDLRTLQELMGHKTITMTARYAHLSDDHKMQALERLAG